MILFCIHFYVVEPISSPNLASNRHFVTFITDNYWYNQIDLIWHKSEGFECLKLFLEEPERQTGHQICVLRSNTGGESRSTRFLAFAASQVICIEQGPAKT